MKLLFSIILSLFSIFSFAQSKDELAVRRVLQLQQDAWNRGDIESFMRGYWKNDSLTFIGSHGINRGWEETLQRYKRSYPDTVSMGKLNFQLLSVKRLSPEYFYVIGKWMLKRTIGDIGGHFDLLFRKINGSWVIISDHSS
jgi:hypothetical protein